MPLRETAPKLSPEKYEENFADITPPMNPRQAAIEAARCLYCFDAPCIQACPTRIDVPGFIKRIMTANVRGAARVILEANILGASCGRVCPTQVLCEGACVMVEKGENAIEIGRLQRFAVDHLLDRNIQVFHAGKANGRRVACIGSGPASLACAAHLARKGYSVTVFDRRELSGGLNTYGIAAYKMRVADSLREVDTVKSLGVEFRQNVDIGRDISFEQLEKDFDVIFIGVGLGETWAMNIPGEDLDGVCGALEFIEATKSQPFSRVAIGRRVACIGAGNTAIDVVTAARRLGADAVYLVYRRSEQEMPAFRYEYELAKKDGVTFLWQTQPVRILGTGGVVTGLECVGTRLGEPDARGKRSPGTIPNSTFTIDVDMVVRAVGQKQATDFLRGVKGIEIRKNGTLVTDAQNRTGNPKYFAGGDCVNGGKEVVDAVAEGMAAGRGIDAGLGAATRDRRGEN
ncbi:MAG TPA: NAD(P)-dependent oxidoreductase [Candidatus Acidoferrales bacterium]|jgi:glutamate synthase (NADPH/NADH) small chain|nr:NAD(P)-dependent oxidoreductase [Candidatus Acidoferrales bacterium]